MTRTERTYYVLVVLYNASWAFLGPVYPLFLLHRGLDLFQLNVVLATYLLTSFLFEVPTGAVADRFGRKVSFLGSCAIRCVAFSLYWFSSSFPAFVFAEFVDAVGSTLATGALDAWAVDGTRAEGNRAPSGRMFGNGHALARAVMIASGVAGSFVAASDIALPWVLGASGFLVTGAVALATMAEPARTVALAARSSVADTIRDGIVLVRDSSVLRALCLLTAVTAFAHMPVMLLWPPRVVEVAGPEMWLLGCGWAVLNAVAMIASGFVSRLPADVPARRLLAAVTAFRALAVLSAALAAGPFGVLAGILVLEGGFGATDPILQARMSDGALASHRATILSLRWMSFTCGAAVGCAALGLASRAFGIAPAWIAASIVLLLASALFWRIYPPEEHRRGAELASAASAVEVTP